MGVTACISKRDKEFNALMEEFNVSFKTLERAQVAYDVYHRAADVEKMRLRAENLGEDFDENKAMSDVKKKVYAPIDAKWFINWADKVGLTLDDVVREKYVKDFNDDNYDRDSDFFRQNIVSSPNELVRSLTETDIKLNDAKKVMGEIKAKSNLESRIKSTGLEDKIKDYEGSFMDKMAQFRHDIFNKYKDGLTKLLQRENWQADGRFSKKGLYGGELQEHPGDLQRGLTTTLKGYQKGDERVFFKKSEPNPATEAGDYVHSILQGISNHIIDLQKNGEWDVSKEAISKWLENNVEKVFEKGQYKHLLLSKGELTKGEIVKNMTTFLERFFDKFWVISAETPLSYYDKINNILTRTNVDLIVMDKRTLDRGIVDFKSKGMENFLDKSAFRHFTEQRRKDIPSSEHAVDLQTQAEAIILNKQMEGEEIFKEDNMREFNNDPFVTKRYAVSIDLAMVKDLNPETNKQRGTLYNMRGAIIEQGKNLLGKDFTGGGCYELENSATTINEAYNKLHIPISPGLHQDEQFQKVMKEMIYSQKNMATVMGSMGATNFRSAIMRNLFDINIEKDYVSVISSAYSEIQSMRDMMAISKGGLPIDILEKFARRGLDMGTEYNHIRNLLSPTPIMDDDGIVVEAPRTYDGLKSHFQETLGLDIDDPGVKDAIVNISNVVAEMTNALEELSNDLAVATKDYLRKTYLPKIADTFMEDLRQAEIKQQITNLHEIGWKKGGVNSAKTSDIDIYKEAVKRAEKVMEKLPENFRHKAMMQAETTLGLFSYKLSSKDMLTSFTELINMFGPISAMKDPIVKTVVEDVQKGLMYKQERFKEIERELRPVVQKLLEKEGGGNFTLMNSNDPYEKMIAYRESERWQNSDGENVEPYIPERTDWREFNKARDRAMEEINQTYNVEVKDPRKPTQEELSKIAEGRNAKAKWDKENREWSPGYEGKETPVYGKQKIGEDGKPYTEILEVKKSYEKAALRLKDKVMSFLDDAIKKKMLDDTGYDNIKRAMDDMVNKAKTEGEDFLLNDDNIGIFDTKTSTSQTLAAQAARAVFKREMDKIRRPIEKYNDPNFKQIENLSEEGRAFYDLYMKYRDMYDVHMGAAKKLGQNLPVYYGDAASAGSVAAKHAKETHKTTSSMLFGSKEEYEDLLSSFEWDSGFKFPYSGGNFNPNDVSHNLGEGIYAIMKSLAHYEAYKETAMKSRLLLTILGKQGGAEVSSSTGGIITEKSQAVDAVKHLVDAAIFHDSVYNGALQHWFKSAVNYSTLVALGANASAAFRSHWMSAFDLRNFYGQKYSDGTRGILYGQHLKANTNYWLQHVSLWPKKLLGMAHIPGAMWENKTDQSLIVDWLGAGENTEWEQLMRPRLLERFKSEGSIWKGVKETLFGFFRMTDNAIKEVTAETMFRNLIAYDKEGKKIGNFYDLIEITGKKGEMVKGKRMDDREVQLKGENNIAFYGQEGTDKKTKYDRAEIQLWYQQMIANTTSVSSIVQEAAMNLDGNAKVLWQLKNVQMKVLSAAFMGVNNPINHDLDMPGRLGNLLDKKYWDLPTKTKFNRLLLTILPGGAMIRNAIRNADIRQLPKTGKFQHADLHQLNFAERLISTALNWNLLMYGIFYTINQLILPTEWLGKTIYDKAKWAGYADSDVKDFYTQKIYNTDSRKINAAHTARLLAYQASSMAMEDFCLWGWVSQVTGWGPKETAAYGLGKKVWKLGDELVNTLKNWELETYKTGPHKDEYKLVKDALEVSPIYGGITSLRNQEAQIKNAHSKGGFYNK
jgi:hypothetical protein